MRRECVRSVQIMSHQPICMIIFNVLDRPIRIANKKKLYGLRIYEHDHSRKTSLRTQFKGIILPT